MFRKEMDKYRDVDEDELLQKLSEEELRRLEDELEELDPDVSALKTNLKWDFKSSVKWNTIHKCAHTVNLSQNTLQYKR